jgi:hypothetical protein
MKKVFLPALIILVCGSFKSQQVADEIYRTMPNKSFKAGEVVEYRVHYGFITAGHAVVETSPDIYKVNNRACYRVTVSGSSSSGFDMFVKIRDTWRSYIDTTSLISQRFYWDVNEGKYHKEETVFIDHVNRKIRSEEKNAETKTFDNIPAHIQDLVSGYYYLRNIDFSKMKDGDVVPVKGFFDDNYFDFKIKFRGRQVVKTKFGKIKCMKITPVMPKNELFDGDSSIRMYVTDDANKIPVKIEADLFVGAVEVEIKAYKNNRHKLNFYR